LPERAGSFLCTSAAAQRPPARKGKSMTLEWSDSLASGSSDIDTQHKELFVRVNSLLHAVDKGTINREEVARIVRYLTDYVVLHFGNEEKYMAKHNYSSATAHKAQHEQFVKTFVKLKDRLLMEGVSAPLAQETSTCVWTG